MCPSPSALNAIMHRPTVRWRVPVATIPHTLLASETGQLVVQSPQQVTVLAADGTVRWTRDGAYGAPPLLLDATRLLVAEDASMSIYDLATGVCTAQLAVKGVTCIARYDAEHIVVRTWSHARGHQLQFVHLDGTVRWTQPLSVWRVDPPLVLGETILVADATIRALTRDGRVAWDIPQPADTAYVGPLTALNARLVVGGFRTERRFPLVRLDLVAQQVQAFDAPFPYDALRVVVTVAGAPMLFAVSYPIPQPDGILRPSLTAVDQHGQEHWRVVLQDAPIALATDGGGNVLVLCSPTHREWEQYGVAYDLQAHCTLTSYDTAGMRRWTWYARGPLAATLAISEAGPVSVFSAGAIWTLGGPGDG